MNVKNCTSVPAIFTGVLTRGAHLTQGAGRSGLSALTTATDAGPSSTADLTLACPAGHQG